MKFADTVKIRGFDTFSNCKSRGGGYRVNHSSPLKMSSKVRNMGLTHVKLKDISSVIRNQLGGRIQNFEVSAYYETAKFTGDQSDLLRKLE